MRMYGLFALALIVVCATGTVAAQVEQPRPLRVLFIGNSLTIANDLPGMIADLAAGAGEPRPLTQMVAVGGFSLEDHWNRGEALRAIEHGPWDFVVLQQGPSAALESRQLLIAFARRFAAATRKAGAATPALYMVWPSLDRQSDFPGVSQSYRRAAASVNGVILPAGDAWRIVLQRHREVQLYSRDRLHPTLAGSYLAAVVIYHQLYSRHTRASLPRWDFQGNMPGGSRRPRSRPRENDGAGGSNMTKGFLLFGALVMALTNAPFAAQKKYHDRDGKLRVSLAKQPFSPNGASKGPTTMADGGIQKILARPWRDGAGRGGATHARGRHGVRRLEAARHGARPLRRHRLEERARRLFHRRIAGNVPVDAGAGGGPAALRADARADQDRHALARRASRLQHA